MDHRTWNAIRILVVALAFLGTGTACTHDDAGQAKVETKRPATGDCPPPYILNGVWSLDEYGPVLAITPTDCGRKVVGAEVDTLILEAIEKFGDNPRFTGNLFGSMNQLACHVKRFPDKPTWNLEPDRPYVGLDNTEAAECNPSVAIPDQPYY